MEIISTISHVSLGGLFGFAWYKIVGCRSGACPLTSNPYISVIYGAFLGLLFGVKG